MEIHSTARNTSTSGFIHAREWSLTRLSLLIRLWLLLSKEKNEKNVIIHITTTSSALDIWLIHCSILLPFWQGLGEVRHVHILYVTIGYVNRQEWLSFPSSPRPLRSCQCSAGFMTLLKFLLSTTLLHCFPHGCFLVDTPPFWR